MNSKFDPNVDFSKIPSIQYNLVQSKKNNVRAFDDNKPSKKIENQIDILNEFDSLTKDFNKSLSSLHFM